MRRVLWTLVPIGSLGLLGWVPPLRIAFRRNTPAAWLWLAGSVVGIVLICVLVTTVRSAPNLKDSPPGWVGVIEIIYIISTAVYTGIATKVLTPKPRLMPPPVQVRESYDRGYDRGYGYGRYPGQPAAHLPPPPVDVLPVDVPTVIVPSAVAPRVVAPNAVDAAAAEVRAELRELRDFLGESAAAEQREAQDRRGEW